MKRTKRTKKLREAEPSRVSLREIPEVDFSRGTSRPNSYAARIAVGGMIVNGKRMPPEPTTRRVVRLRAKDWMELGRVAAARGLTTRAAITIAVIEWIQRNARRRPG